MAQTILALNNSVPPSYLAPTGSKTQQAKGFAGYCAWGVLLTLPQMSEICAARHVGSHGRLRPWTDSPQPAESTVMVSVRHSQHQATLDLWDPL